MTRETPRPRAGEDDPIVATVPDVDGPLPVTLYAADGRALRRHVGFSPRVRLESDRMKAAK